MKVNFASDFNVRTCHLPTNEKCNIFFFVDTAEFDNKNKNNKETTYVFEILSIQLGKSSSKPVLTVLVF